MLAEFAAPAAGSSCPSFKASACDGRASIEQLDEAAASSSLSSPSLSSLIPRFCARRKRFWEVFRFVRLLPFFFAGSSSNA